MMISRREIESLRPPRVDLSPWSKPRVSYELEPNGKGGVAFVTTVFLTGAECPYRCSMCDLWKHTTIEPTPIGAIPFQLREALREESAARCPTNTTERWLKLYNASNFFDPRAVPAEDLAEIANLCDGFDRIVVENHPKLTDGRILQFANSIKAKLELAMGLETIHPEAIKKLNKSMTLEDFESAVQFCSHNQIDVRSFVLLHPPGVDRVDSVDWTWRTIDYAFEVGTRHVSVIPVRSGNGWVDQQSSLGRYSIPDQTMITEFFEALHSNLTNRLRSRLGPQGKGVLLFDLWDWEKIPGGTEDERTQLLQRVQNYNTSQQFGFCNTQQNEQSLDDGWKP